MGEVYIMSETTASGSSTATFSGQTASPGTAYGPLFLSIESVDSIPVRRLADSEVEAELDRVDSVARAARVGLVRQRDALGDRFTEEQTRIFDTHLRMLEDPVIEADIRGRIREDHLSLEGAVRDALSVYERLFEVVETEALRNKLADMRDVALRLLRHCNRGTASDESQADRTGGILLVRELSLSDLTGALDSGIAAIVAEGGSMGSHGAILTRAAGIPAILGVGGLHDAVQAGDRLLVDGESGQVTLNPSDAMVAALDGQTGMADIVELEPAVLADGTPIQLTAAAASPREVRRAAAMGIKEVGFYRTELPLIQRRANPKEDSLANLYGKVVGASDAVSFRLPDLDSQSGLTSIYTHAETNPAMGLRGVRVLLENPAILATQIRAILRASEGHDVRIAIPFVTDLGDIRAVRTAVDEAREVMRLEGLDVSHPVRLGLVLETPASLLMGRELLGQVDFALLALDGMAQSLLASDRSNEVSGVGGRLAQPHPVVLRAVRKLVQICDGLGREFGVYGNSVCTIPMLPLLVGLGVRRLAVRTESLAEVHGWLRDIELDTCQRVAEVACHAATSHELLSGLPASWRD